MKIPETSSTAMFCLKGWMLRREDTFMLAERDAHHRHAISPASMLDEVAQDEHADHAGQQNRHLQVFGHQSARKSIRRDPRGGIADKGRTGSRRR